MKDIPTLQVTNPRMLARDLVALTGAGKSGAEKAILRGDASLNGDILKDPEQMLLLKTDDRLCLEKTAVYKIKIVSIQKMETERLLLNPLELGDLGQIQNILPKRKIADYLKTPMRQKDAQHHARDVFARVIGQPEPKTEWLWKIQPKETPEKIIGVAHLRTDDAEGNQNIWLDKKQQDKGFAEEVMSAINDHAFGRLGFEKIVYKNAFEDAILPKEIEALRNKFKGLEERKKPSRAKGAWGLSRKGWQKFRSGAGTPGKPKGK